MQSVVIFMGRVGSSASKEFHDNLGYYSFTFSLYWDFLFIKRLCWYFSPFIVENDKRMRISERKIQCCLKTSKMMEGSLWSISLRKQFYSEEWFIRPYSSYIFGSLGQSNTEIWKEGSLRMRILRKRRR